MIDVARLEKVKHGGSRTSARCPACAAEGGDRNGNNLSIKNDTGAFTCARYPGEAGREHRREIFRLVGIREDRDPEQDRQWRQGRVKLEAEAAKRRQLSRTVIAKRAAIIAAHPWTSAEARAESPEKRLGWLHDPRRFIAAMFPAEALVWTGSVNQSGTRHAARWKTTAQWQDEPEDTVGPMIAPATWKPGTVSRAGEHVATAPFTVLDFDGFDGRKPETPEELREHLTASMAIIRWLRERLQWHLAALIHTGNKSLHAWFSTPSPAALQSLRDTGPALGIDAGLIGHPEHPCRLPGWIHPKTGKPARVIFLAPSIYHHHP